VVDEECLIFVPDDYATIQDAINAVSIEGEIIVRNGIYLENISFSSKLITVRSENGAENTVIDGQAAGSVVTFSTGEGTSPVLDGFTIKNGSAELGGGIYCNGALPTISNCTIRNNTALGGYDGGIHCSDS